MASQLVPENRKDGRHSRLADPLDALLLLASGLRWSHLWFWEGFFVDITEFKVSVRTENGVRGNDAWIRRGELALAERLGPALVFILGGLAVGSLLIFVPLIHLLGVFVAITGIVLGVKRLGRRYVISAAGGVCPRCGQESTFLDGLGRPKFRLPVTASCSACGIAMTLLST